MFSTIKKISEKLKDGHLSAEKLCEITLNNIKANNPVLAAFSDVTAESALHEARTSDIRRRNSMSLGPLDGIPIAVKDLIDTTPAICSSGLEHLRSYKPKKDAAIVKRLRDAGAVIVGVTQTDPGAFSTDTPA